MFGERARLGRCSVRLAPNMDGVTNTKRLDNFERSCEPRGRDSLRPEAGALLFNCTLVRITAPFSAARFFLSFEINEILLLLKAGLAKN